MVRRTSSSPVWNDWLTFPQLSAEELESKVVLEVTVWDKNSAQKANDFLGGVRLGPDPNVAMATDQRVSWMDSVPEEVDYWSTMLSSAGLYVERWLPLRPTMQSRNVSTAPAKRLSSPVPPESKDTEIAKEDSSSLRQSPALSTTPVTAIKDSSSLPQSPALSTTPVTAIHDSTSLPQSPALPTTPVITVQDSPRQVCIPLVHSLGGWRGEGMRQGVAKEGRDWRREGLEEDLLPSSYSFPLPNHPTSIPSHFHPFPLPSHTFLSPFLVHLPPTPHDLPPHPSLSHSTSSLTLTLLPPSLHPPSFLPPHLTLSPSCTVEEAQLQAPRDHTATARGSRAHAFSVGESWLTCD